jgi:hypothetical protein
MAAASRSLATALWEARFASGLLQPSYTIRRDRTGKSLSRRFDRHANDILRWISQKAAFYASPLEDAVVSNSFRGKAGQAPSQFDVAQAAPTRNGRQPCQQHVTLHRKLERIPAFSSTPPEMGDADFLAQGLSLAAASNSQRHQWSSDLGSVGKIEMNAFNPPSAGEANSTTALSASRAGDSLSRFNVVAQLDRQPDQFHRLVCGA